LAFLAFLTFLVERFLRDGGETDFLDGGETEVLRITSPGELDFFPFFLCCFFTFFDDLDFLCLNIFFLCLSLERFSKESRDFSEFERSPKRPF